MAGLSRRRLLVTIGVAAGTAPLGVPVIPARADPPAPSRWTAPESQNGWPVTGDVIAYRIEGSDASVTLAPAAAVLVYVARRFHYEVDALAAGEVAGHRTDPKVRTPGESNFLSGTAIALRPGAYPPGAADVFFPPQLAAIRDILAGCGGLVRWGGDDPLRPSPGHFQLGVPPADGRLRRLRTARIA